MEENCYIIFDYAWYLSGVKPVRNYFKSFASIQEAGEYLISLFNRDFDEDIFGTLLPEEEIDEVKAAITELRKDFIVHKTTNSKVKLDLSCFEFKINALCIWPNGAKKILETIVEILQEEQKGDLKVQYESIEGIDESEDTKYDLIYEKAQVLLQTKTSELDQEKFDEVFDDMVYNHPYNGVF